jgi:hypothetical protein
MVATKDGERGRNRTYNLLIKSYSSRFGCSVINCGRHNHLTIKRPAWTAFKNVEKVGEIERHLIGKDTKRTQASYSFGSRWPEEKSSFSKTFENLQNCGVGFQPSTFGSRVPPSTESKDNARRKEKRIIPQKSIA